MVTKLFLLQFCNHLINMAKNKSAPIGVFDSGFGGLEILKRITSQLPTYDYLYLGDTARTPYGSRSPEVIYQFTQQAVDFLFKQGCPLVIIACNTSSAEALPKIQQIYLKKKYPRRRVLGVIIPAAEAASEKTSTGRIGVIGTEGTVRSNAFVREIIKLSLKTKVFQQACPLLVPLVEAGEEHSAIAELVLRKYLRPLLKHNIDTLILGCTHYGLLETAIKRAVGSKVKVIAEGRVVADKLAAYLVRHPEINEQLSRGAQRRFLTTDLTARFEKLGSRFFGRKIKPEKVVLGP